MHGRDRFDYHLILLFEDGAELQRNGFHLQSDRDHIELVLGVENDDLVVGEGHDYPLEFKVDALGAIDFFRTDLNEGKPVVSLQFGEDADEFAVVDQIEKDHPFFLLEVGHDVSLAVAFAEVLDDEGGVDLAGGVEGVEDVVVQHHVLEVFEAGDLLLLPEVIHDLLILGQHVVEDNLLAQDVDDLVIVDAVGTRDGVVLIVAEALFKSEAHAVLQIAAVVEHGFAFLNKVWRTNLEPRESGSCAELVFML